MLKHNYGKITVVSMMLRQSINMQNQTFIIIYKACCFMNYTVKANIFAARGSLFKRSPPAIINNKTRCFKSQNM